MPKKKAPAKDEKVYTLNQDENYIVENLEVTDILQLTRVYTTRNEELKKQSQELEEQVRKLKDESLKQNFSKQFSVDKTTEDYKLLRQLIVNIRFDSEYKLKELSVQKLNNYEELDEKYEKILFQKQNIIQDLKDQLDYIIKFPEREIEYLSQIDKLNNQIALIQKNQQKDLDNFQQNELKQKSIQENKFVSDLQNIMEKAFEKAENYMISSIGNDINSRKQNERLELNLDLNKKEYDFLEKDREKLQNENLKIDQKMKLNDQGLEQFKQINHQQTQKIKTLQDRINYSKQFIAKEIANYQTELENIKFVSSRKQEENIQIIKNIQEKLRIQGRETLNILSLVQMIMDQRSETEEIFLQSLFDFQKEIKVDKIVSQHFKPAKYYQKIMSISDLEWHQREQIIKLMFQKINQNFQPIFWRETTLQ